MKNSYLLALIGLCFTISLSAQQIGTWTNKGSRITASSRGIWSISAVDSNTVWATAYHLRFSQPFREFTKTTDGGNTWKSGVIDPTSGEDFSILSSFALDSSIAWVTMSRLSSQNQGRIYKTSDGGKTWAKQSGSFNNLGNLPDCVYFFNKNEGIAFGATVSNSINLDTLRIWRTVNGGIVWNRVPEANLPARLPAEITYVGPGTGVYDTKGDTVWIVSDVGRVWKSTNKGATWNAYLIVPEQPFPNYSDASIAFQDALNGIALVRNRAFRTTDGGITWEELDSPLFTVYSYYQIKDIPGAKDTYFLSYENSNRFNDIQHAFTVDNGNTWFKLDSEGLECFDFVSPNHAWGGNVISSPTTGGMYLWKGDFQVDYFIAATLKERSNYSMITPRQLSNFGWDVTYQSAGQQPLNIETAITISKEGSIVEQRQPIETIPAKKTINLPIDFSPADFGAYECLVTGKSTNDRYNFSYTASKSFELNESILAKDDGGINRSAGFGTIDPMWYGYYGSNFDLVVADTLRAITVYISNSSDYTGSINLTVTAFDETGRPRQELLHTAQLTLSAYGVSASNPKLTYQLPEPLVLLPGKYLFAAGQDTIQGAIGFGFDTDNIQQDGYWITSPVVGGGYPWRQISNSDVLMIRPHFTPSAITTTSTKDIAASRNNFKVYPNPTSGEVTIELDETWKHTSVEISIHDLLGKQMDLQTIHPTLNTVHLDTHLAGGIYLLTLKQGDHVQTTKLVIE